MKYCKFDIITCNKGIFSQGNSLLIYALQTACGTSDVIPYNTVLLHLPSNALKIIVTQLVLSFVLHHTISEAFFFSLSSCQASLFWFEHVHPVIFLSRWLADWWILMLCQQDDFLMKYAQTPLSDFISINCAVKSKIRLPPYKLLLIQIPHHVTTGKSLHWTSNRQGSSSQTRSIQTLPNPLG